MGFCVFIKKKKVKAADEKRLMFFFFWRKQDLSNTAGQFTETCLIICLKPNMLAYLQK